MLFRKSNFINAFCNIPIIIIVVLLFTNIIFAGNLYNQIKVSHEYEKEIEEKDVIVEKLKNIQKEEIQEKAIAYYAQQIQKLINEEELAFLAQKQWEYTLTLNGNRLKQNTIYITEDSVRIILAELVIDKDILPKEILEKGTVTGSDPNDPLQEHLNIFTNIPYTTKMDENSRGRRVIYDFNNIPQGTVISLKISPMLAERLEIGVADQQLENLVEIIRK